jgi:perosamine synthetase
MNKRIFIAEPVLDGNEKKYLNDCVDTTWLTWAGKYVGEFERQFAAFCGTKYAVACANGTVSLHLSLVALGIGEGDEVIVPTFTYIASANAVKYCGATPVFVDCAAATWNIDISKIEAAITTKTKVIMPVHLYGLTCDMNPILELAKKYNLYVIEDAAEALGAEYCGKKSGSFGIANSFSLFGNKIITCGEGGGLQPMMMSLMRECATSGGRGKVRINAIGSPI